MKSDKKKWLILWLVLIGLVFISLGISIWSLVLSRASLDGFQLEFSYDALGTIIGIILSAVALVISLYFVILGIGANSVRREIKEEAKDTRERIKDDADKQIRKTIEEIKEEAVKEANKAIESVRDEVSKEAEIITKRLRDENEKESKENRVIIIEIIDELYSEVIARTREFYNSISSEENKQKEPVIKLKLNQCRHACNPKNLDFEDNNRAKKIIMNGINLIPDLSSDKNDLKMLVEITNKSKDQDIKGASQYAIMRLNDKLNLGIVINY